MKSAFRWNGCHLRMPAPESEFPRALLSADVKPILVSPSPVEASAVLRKNPKERCAFLMEAP